MIKQHLKKYWLVHLIFMHICLSCTPDHPAHQGHLIKFVRAQDSGIAGKVNFINTPYVTAGDRVYMVGHQNGWFPEIGWHVAGEMGGIWNHPIKLLDGFTASLQTNQSSYCLDSAALFINYPYANVHVYPSREGISIERFQFVPDGKEAVVVEYTFHNETDETVDFQFAFTVFTELMPVWLGERTGMIDSQDEWIEKNKKYLLAKDRKNDWYVMAGANRSAADTLDTCPDCKYAPEGMGTQGGLQYSFNFEPNQSEVLHFVIAGSTQSREEVMETFLDVHKNAGQYLLEKSLRYKRIANKARLTVPDSTLQKAFEWTKYNVDWLIREVPGQGRGLGAGIPDYPWWFGADNEYALQAAIAIGQKDLVYSTIELLYNYSEQASGNGRVVHEVSTNGAVFNPGNINETPQFATLIWKVFCWTGDLDFLKKYYPFIKKGLSWLLEENDIDGNLLPEGYGMIEIHGLDGEMIDVASYTSQAFYLAAEMASVLEEHDLAAEYLKKADQIREIINTTYWVDDFDSYADFVSEPEKAVQLMDSAIQRARYLDKPWAVEEITNTKTQTLASNDPDKRGFVLYRNWAVNTPMETGIADQDKALRALETARNYTNPFGVFVTGIDRDESADADDGSFEGTKEFSYIGAVMTLPTGVQAVAESQYGRSDQALEYIQKMVRSFSFALPGSMYEVSPDYGMMTQAWNLYGLAVPVIEHFFGIQPRAHLREIHLRPSMPEAWPTANIEHLLIGDNEVSARYRRKDRQIEIQLLQSQDDYTIHFDFPAGRYANYTVNGKKVKLLKDEVNRSSRDVFQSGESKITLTMDILP